MSAIEREKERETVMREETVEKRAREREREGRRQRET